MGIESTLSDWEADDPRFIQEGITLGVSPSRSPPESSGAAGKAGNPPEQWDGETAGTVSRRRCNWRCPGGHRWLAMVESGKFKSPKEIPKRECVDTSYVSRMVNLTTLAPEIVAAFLDETVPPDVTLFDLAVDPPLLWEKQRSRIDGMIPRS